MYVLKLTFLGTLNTLQERNQSEVNTINNFMEVKEHAENENWNNDVIFA